MYSRGISDFKKGYQPRTNTAKDGKGDLVTNTPSILARWRNHFSQLLNVHGVKDVRQTELHTAEPLVAEPSAFEVEMAIEKLKRHKSPGIDQIPAEMIKLGGRTVCCEIQKPTNSIWNEDELPEDWQSLYLFIGKAIKQTVVIIGAITFVNYVQNFIQHAAVKVNSICRGNYWESSVWILTQQVNY